jgi:hypothetical protein
LKTDKGVLDVAAALSSLSGLMEHFTGDGAAGVFLNEEELKLGPCVPSAKIICVGLL